MARKPFAGGAYEKGGFVGSPNDGDDSSSSSSSSSGSPEDDNNSLADTVGSVTRNRPSPLADNSVEGANDPTYSIFDDNDNSQPEPIVPNIPNIDIPNIVQETIDSQLSGIQSQVSGIENQVDSQIGQIQSSVDNRISQTEQGFSNTISDLRSSLGNQINQQAQSINSLGENVGSAFEGLSRSVSSLAGNDEQKNKNKKRSQEGDLPLRQIGVIGGLVAILYFVYEEYS